MMWWLGLVCCVLCLSGRGSGASVYEKPLNDIMNRTMKSLMVSDDTGLYVGNFSADFTYHFGTHGQLRCLDGYVKDLWAIEPVFALYVVENDTATDRIVLEAEVFLWDWITFQECRVNLRPFFRQTRSLNLTYTPPRQLIARLVLSQKPDNCSAVFEKVVFPPVPSDRFRISAGGVFPYMTTQIKEILREHVNTQIADTLAEFYRQKFNDYTIPDDFCNL